MPDSIECSAKLVNVAKTITCTKSGTDIVITKKSDEEINEIQINQITNPSSTSMTLTVLTPNLLQNFTHQLLFVSSHSSITNLPSISQKIGDTVTHTFTYTHLSGAI